MTRSGIQRVMVGGLWLALAACAHDQPHMVGGNLSAAPASQTATAAAQAAGKPKLVCEETRPLGSLLPQRICLTPEEAAARKKASQEAIRNIQNSSSGTQNGGGGG